MNQKILSEIKKIEARNKKVKRVKALPSSILCTDRTRISDFEKTINSLPKNSAILIREYDLDKKNREIFTQKISALARGKDLKILVGKDITLAKKIKADGIHFSDFDKLPLQFLQQKKFNKKFIFSFACHNIKSLKKAHQIKADIAFISPIFPTKSHLKTKSLGLKSLAKISLKTKTTTYFHPEVYALGGINSKNITSVRKLGISGFAAISLFFENL